MQPHTYGPPEAFAVYGPPVDFRSLLGLWTYESLEGGNKRYLVEPWMHGDLGFEKCFLDFGEHFDAELTQSVQGVRRKTDTPFRCKISQRF
jgi:hypothetical protein